MTTLDGYPMARKGQAGRGAGALRHRLLRRRRSSPPGASSSSRRSWSSSRCCSARPNISRSSPWPSPRSAASASRNQAKAAIAAALGLGIAMIGVDGQTGVPRLTFGNIHLYDGIDFLVAIVGLFALSEVFLFLEHKRRRRAAARLPKIGRITAPLVDDPRHRRHDGARHRRRLPRRRAAGRRRLARLVHRLHAGKAAQGPRRHLRQGRPPRRRGAGGRQQRRRRRRAGADAGARRARLGHHGGAARHAARAQHHARAPPVHPAPGRGLGPDRGAVHRQYRCCSLLNIPMVGMFVRVLQVPPRIPDAGGRDDLLRRHLRHLGLDLRPSR